MILLTLSLMMTVAPSAAAVVPPNPQDKDQAAFEAVFTPLPSAERMYSVFGPAGPFYPQAALRRTADGVSATTGEAVLECAAGAEGVLERCRIVSETPMGFNFGVAARVLADRHRILVTGAPSSGDLVRARVRFDPKMPVAVSP